MRMKGNEFVRNMKRRTIDLDKAIIIDDPIVAGTSMFERLDDIEKAKSGRTISEGGVLPDDNVRVYIPLDINADSLLYELRMLFYTLGMPDESDEFSYFEGMRKIYRKLEIYDEALMEKYPEQTMCCSEEGKKHSIFSICVVREMIQIMEENEGCGEMFPYDTIDTLEEEYTPM